MALLNCGVKADDPLVRRGLDYLRKVEPEFTYVVGLQTTVFAEVGDPKDGPRVPRNVNWLMEVGARPGVERRPVFTVNNAYAILRGLESGLGIAALPDFMVPETQGLVRLLPDAPTAEIEAYFVYPEELRSSKRIAVFRDFLLRKVAEAKNG